ncbi:MAG: hypothetical protein KDD43_12655, partial [Bdellovibrionales bacterium]|nr:hypothetical protein [Bdellovibrionales bacterium]
MNKIQKFSTSRRGYGGNVYERYVDRVLSKHFRHEPIDLSFHLKGWFRLIEFPVYVLRLLLTSLFPNGFLIRNFQTSFLPLKKKHGLTIVFHIDETLSPLASRIFQRGVERLFFLFARKSDPIVVISKYWKKYFEDRGFTDVHLIYCPYELELYEISDEEIEDFKRRFGLGDKPMVYIGKKKKKKGEKKKKKKKTKIKKTIGKEP